MRPTRFTVLLDACVLYPAPLRDLLMHVALTDLFRVRWTDQIHDEWIRNLVAKGMNAQKLHRTRTLMNAAVPDCLVTGYEALVKTLLLPDPDDRHVLAAAVKGRADTIVTFNLKHFPSGALKPFGIKAQHPDEFLICQFDLDEPAVVEAVRQQRANLKNPPFAVEDFLAVLSKQQLPRTVQRLRKFAALI